MNLLHGLALGMSTALILGPVFFTLLRNSLQKSISNGLLTALGILASDVLVLSICYAFAGDFVQKYIDSPYIKFFAAAVLIGFGVSFIRSRNIDLSSKSLETNTKVNLKSFGQGFLVNFANPTVFIIWIGFLTIAETDYSTSLGRLIFLIGILLGVFVTDVAKALGASYLSNFLNSHSLKNIFGLLGFILIAVGFFIGYQGFTDLY
jgi:threonine/homoserine/homoserine lactone efflux protein